MKKRKPDTVAVHGSSEPEHKSGPLATPIFQTSTFSVEDNDEQLRVTGKNKDDLQAAMKLIRGADLSLPLQFKNFRD